ncbi:reverse transcriptase domain, reverse transcriptase zinc-binding domain protein [Tanacetum coccineum]
MRCGVGEFSFTHLRLPIGDNMRRVGAWDNVVRVIKSIYGESGGLGDIRGVEGAVGRGGVWRDIIRVGEELDGLGVNLTSSFVGEVGNGSEIRFWIDTWVGGVRFCDRFPRLYHLDRRKEGMVEEKGKWVDNVWCWDWEWVRDLRGRVCKDFEELLTILQNVLMKVDCRDRWRWTLQENSRLPVREELDNRGIDLDSLLCPSCGDVVESCSYCLVMCNFARSVWEKIFGWWKIGNVNAFSIEEFFSLNGNANVPSLLSKMWQAVIWTFGYFIWKERNMRVFKGKASSLNKIVQDIQLKSFEWISRRAGKERVLFWQQWMFAVKSCLVMICSMLLVCAYILGAFCAASGCLAYGDAFCGAISVFGLWVCFLSDSWLHFVLAIF